MRLPRFFRNIFPSRVDQETVELLIRSFEKLDDEKFRPNIDQLRAGLLKYELTTDSTARNLVNFTFDPEISKKYEDPAGRFFRVTGINVENDAASTGLSIYITHGLVFGYKFESDFTFSPRLSSIDVTNARVEFLDPVIPEVKELLPPELIDAINWSDVYEIELDGRLYYHLKDTEDGDFIALDEQGNTFEITHDPFEIKPIAKGQ